MLLGSSSNDERWNVDRLLADGDVSSSYQDSSVVDRRGELALKHKGLKASLH